MKKVTVAMFLLMAAIAQAQYVPMTVEKIMQDSATLATPIDTVRYDNYNYIFSVKGDSNLVRWELINSYRLYKDHWKTAGIVYFGVNMAAFIAAPQYGVPADKYLHFAVGYVAGVTVDLLVYKWTKNKWIAAAAGLVAGGGLGWAKEYIWDAHTGGVVSNRDWLATSGGAADGVGGCTIVIGHKQKQKQYIQP